VAVVAGVVALAAIGAGIVLVAGGGPSRAEFAADADAVCAEGNDALDLDEPTSYPELATASTTLAGGIRDQVNALGSLDAPGGAAGEAVDAFLAGLDRTAAAAGDLGDVAASPDDPATARAAGEVDSSFQAVVDDGEAFGFRECSLGLRPGVEAVLGGSHAVVKASFVASAEAACREAVRALDAVPFPEDTAASFAGFLDETQAVFDTMIAEIAALAVPPGDGDEVAAMMAALEAVAVKSGEAVDAAYADDFSRFDALDQEVAQLWTAADAKLDAYGLAACGSNFGL